MFPEFFTIIYSGYILNCVETVPGFGLFLEGIQLMSSKNIAKSESDSSRPSHLFMIIMCSSTIKPLANNAW